MEAEVIKRFIPDLVTAISDCVQPVSDQCLAQGLVPDTVYRTVLESGGTSENKARALILAIKKSTETDNRCLEILLSILDQQLPHGIKDKVLSAIRKELTETANSSRAVVPLSQSVQHVPSGDLPKECALQQSSLLGRFEDSIRQHERACAEKNLLEKNLKTKSEECERLKDELEALKSQSHESASIHNAQDRLAACESEITNLKTRIYKMEITIEEQSMQAKRGRNTVIMQTKELFAQLHIAQQEIRRKEKEHRVTLLETEAMTQKKAEEIRLKDLEYKLAIQEKELRIRELEIESKKHKESFDMNVINPPDKLYSHHFRYLLDLLLVQKSKWRNLGFQLGFSAKELDDLQDAGSRKLACLYTGRYNKHDGNMLDKQCLGRLLKQWLKRYPEDNRGSTSYATHTGLKLALINAGLGEVARDLPSYTFFDEHRSLSLRSESGGMNELGGMSYSDEEETANSSPD